MSVPAVELTPAAVPIADRLERPRADPAPLGLRRLNMMRIGYLFMAVGLVLVKWPLIINGTVATLPVYEGVVAVLLTAMSVLAFLGRCDAAGADVRGGLEADLDGCRWHPEPRRR
jgi:hypothetical protein